MINTMNKKKVILLAGICLIAALLYQFSFVNMKIFDYAMSIRAPKLLVMALTAFCIGSASIVFQTLINNTIVTPCLLGMNSLYILIHTIIVFVLGSGSFLVTTKLLSFSLDLVIMGIASIFIYGVLFKKTKGNVLFILLAGSIMATLFTSITSTMQRVMDPNEFATLQSALIASFHKVNTEIVVFSMIAIITIPLILRKELQLLDVISLGKDQAINLGVDFDKVVQKLLIGVTLYIAIATALVGPISFLGLIIANLSRQLFKTHRHIYLMIGATLFGMVLLFTGQFLIERLFQFSTNISVFINVGGGIYFLFLVLRNRR